jgi:hypothetical protein
VVGRPAAPVVQWSMPAQHEAFSGNVCGDRHLRCEDHLGCDDRPPCDDLHGPAPALHQPGASLIFAPPSRPPRAGIHATPLRAGVLTRRKDARPVAFAASLLLETAACAVPRSRTISDPSAAPPGGCTGFRAHSPVLVLVLVTVLVLVPLRRVRAQLNLAQFRSRGQQGCAAQPSSIGMARQGPGLRSSPTPRNETGTAAPRFVLIGRLRRRGTPRAYGAASPRCAVPCAGRGRYSASRADQAPRGIV